MHIKFFFFFKLVWGDKQKANYLNYFEADMKRAEKGCGESSRGPFCSLQHCVVFEAAEWPSSHQTACGALAACVVPRHAAWGPIPWAPGTLGSAPCFLICKARRFFAAPSGSS